MKLGAKQIDGFLKKPKQVAGTLVYGPDRGLVRQRVDAIASEILETLDDPFNRTDITEEKLLEDPAILADEMASISLMGGQRLIVLRDVGDKAAALIKEAVIDAPQDNYLLVYADELGPRSPLRQLFESESTLAALPCYKDDGYGLQQLIAQTLAGHGFRASKEVTDYLLAHLGGDRMIILSELEKISLYFDGENQLELEPLQQLVESSNDVSLDELGQAFAGRRADVLCRVLDRLLVSGVQPVMMLRHLHRQLDRLAQIHQSVRQGQSVEQAIGALRPPVFFKQKTAYAGYVRQWSFSQVRQAQHQLMQLEYQVKTQHEIAETQLRQSLLWMVAAPLDAVA